MKKLLFLTVLLLTSVGAFAQLFVRPAAGSPNTDSFVYVKNEIIYVEGAVELEKNAGPASPGAVSDTEASIYLRNGGQLIQGGTTSINKGNGFLSVQQNTKPTNAYAYYDWCSPVGNPTLSSSGNTNFGLGSIYEDKNIQLGEGTKAQLSANISGKEGFSSPLTISRRWMTVMMTPGTEKYANFIRINAGNGAPAGYGFTMKGVNEGTGGPLGNTTLDQTYEFRGRPNNGDFKITVMGPTVTGNTNPPDVAVESAKMTLSGNPYPSALDLNKLYWDNTTLNAIYFYDEDRSKMTHLYSQKPYGYGVWVPGPEDTTPGGDPAGHPGFYTAASFFIWNAAGQQTGSGYGSGSNDQNKRYAPIGQGFMLVGNGPDGTSQDAYIRNSHRVFRQEGTYSIFQRPDTSNGNITISSDNDYTNTAGRTSGAIPSLDNRSPQLRLYVVFDDALSRDLLLVFSPQATDGVDRGFDGLSPMGMKSEAYFPIGQIGNRMPYVIQGTNFDPLKQIPITFKLHKTSQIEVRAVEEINKPYQKAYLYDQQENTYRPLGRAHSLVGTFTLPAGTYENRFFIVFRARNSQLSATATGNKLNIQNQVMANVGVFQNNPAKQLEVSNPEGYAFKSASVYDMSGKLVISENNLGDNTNFSFYTGNLSDGVYLVKLRTSDDIIIDYKAMVMNR